MDKSILVDKSIQFAVRIVKLYKYMETEQKEYTLSKQILRSGTSIGANINEARYGQSKADFAAKMQIALKETAETEYCITLLGLSEYISTEMQNSLTEDCLEIKRLLIATINTVKNN